MIPQVPRYFYSTPCCRRCSSSVTSIHENGRISSFHSCSRLDTALNVFRGNGSALSATLVASTLSRIIGSSVSSDFLSHCCPFCTACTVIRKSDAFLSFRVVPCSCLPQHDSLRRQDYSFRQVILLTVTPSSHYSLQWLSRRIFKSRIQFQGKFLPVSLRNTLRKAGTERQPSPSSLLEVWPFYWRFCVATLAWSLSKTLALTTHLRSSQWCVP